MILVVKKKILIIIVAVLLMAAVIFGTTYSIVKAAAPKNEITVVLDAGHGGRDNGVIGISSGVTEKELNLEICLLVKNYLEKANIKVALTRENDEGLYGEVTSNYKRADMKKRKEIIQQVNPAVVISIHTNKFPDSSRRGAQVFFEQMSNKSKLLATSIQTSLNTLNKEKIEKEFSALKGNYYILKCTNIPSAIVECGFLSNAEDDILLQTPEYRDKLAYQIYSGIAAYLSENTVIDFSDDYNT